jgi:4-hydroxythreonine-4-phosphate dehydrogenase
MTTKVRIAMVIGDPSGIGPEITAKVLADATARQQANILLIADRAEVEQGMRYAGSQFPYKAVASPDAFAEAPGEAVTLYDFRGNTSGPFAIGQSNEMSGRYCLDTLKVAVSLARAGKVDGIAYAPLNKTSLHLAGMTQGGGELSWFAEQLGYTGPYTEFNVLGDLWTSRVTSHVAIQKVSSLLTQEAIIEVAELTHGALRQSGLAEPRMAVCGLNPHNGDNGNFGREEIDVIAPAVKRLRAKGMQVDGPFPPDTIFIKVQGENKEYDAIVTMYHDQGQIAMKLMGFWRGVTVLGGLPVPVTTTAHGSGFDIVGKGKANPGSLRNALGLACRMAQTKQQAATRS